MLAQTKGIKTKVSKHGGIFYHVDLEAENGNRYYTCIYPRYKNESVKNFQRWEAIVKGMLENKHYLLTGLKVKSLSLVDADSRVSILKEI